MSECTGSCKLAHAMPSFPVTGKIDVVISVQGRYQSSFQLFTNALIRDASMFEALYTYQLLKLYTYSIPFGQGQE